MKRRFLALLSVLILSSWLYADYTRGVYGKIEYVLMNDNISDKYNSTNRKSFIQNYQIGYEKFIYSPRLLTYDLGLSFYIDNSTTDVTNSGNTSRSENETKHTNYKAYLHFIKESDYPFTIYYEKKDSPLWSSTVNDTTLVTYKTDSSGLYGRVKMDAFNFNYEYRQSDTEKRESFAHETGNNKRFAIGLDKQFDENKTLTFTYSHEIRDYYRRDDNGTVLGDWNDVVDSANIAYSWVISKTLQMSAYANYMKNDYLDYENSIGTVSLRYRPSRKHAESLSLTADTTKTKNGTNNTLSLSENGSYQVTESFSTNHNFQIYDASGDLYNLTLITGTFGTNYIKRFSETLNASLGASVTGRNETYDYSDENISIQDRNIISYNLSTSMSKTFKESRSNINAGLSYYQLISSTSDATQRVSLNAGYNKNFTDQLKYNLKLYSTYDNNTYTSTDNNETQRTTKIFSADTSLDYWRAVGYNGKMALKAGVNYSAGTYLNRVNPYGTFSFFYMLRRDLLFKTLARVSTDTGYNITSYTGTSDLIYRIRKIEIRTGVQWSRQTGGSFGSRDHINYFFRISRRI